MTKLLRVRWGVRAALVGGVAASVAGNVLHARGGIVSQVIAAWSPLALLVTIELIARVPVHRRGLAAARWAATALIAGIAAWVSYWHMAGVALRYGETSDAAHLLPLSVDGLIVVASICLVELGGRIRAAEEINEGERGGQGQDARRVREAAERGGQEVLQAAGLGLQGPDRPAREQGHDERGRGDSASDGAAARREDGLVAPAEIKPPRPPARKPHTNNPQRIARAHRNTPDATHKELADRLNLSPATVKKHRPPREPQKVNGNAPDLELEGVK